MIIVLDFKGKYLIYAIIMANAIFFWKFDTWIFLQRLHTFSQILL